MQINIQLDHNDEPSRIAAILAAAGGLPLKPIVVPAGAASDELKAAVAQQTPGAIQQVTSASTADAAAQPDKPKVGRPKKQTATQADPAPDKEPPAEPKAEEPRKVDDAEMRDALKRVAQKAGNGDELGGIAKVEEILGQFGVQDRRKLTPEQVIECYDLCLAYLAE